MNSIDRKKFPELDKLLWDRKTRLLQPKDAARTYERRWGFVDTRNLTQDEKQLIDTLAREEGGYFPVPI